MAGQEQAYIQYLGTPGGTKDCLEAIEVLLQSPMRVREAVDPAGVRLRIWW